MKANGFSDGIAPLDGLRVIDLTIAVAGPYATRMLADLGADVIRVDTRVNRNVVNRLGLGARLQATYPNGDPGAEPGNAPGSHAQLNRNKRSIALDLESGRDKDVFLQLVDTADCLVENFTPRVMPSLGLSAQTLLARNPKLVYAALSGCGMTGPQANYPSFAPTAEASAGLAARVGYADGQRVINPMSLGDYVAGMNLAAAVTAALWMAREQGVGSIVDLSQVEAIVSVMGEEFVEAPPGRAESSYPMGNNLPGASLSGVYPARGYDEWVAISAATDEELQALLDFAGIDTRECVEHRSRETRVCNCTHERLAGWTAGFAKAELASVLQARGIGCAPVNAAPDLLGDTQLHDLGFFFQIEDGPRGLAPFDGQPWHFDRWPNDFRRPARSVGADTDVVRAELGTRPNAAKPMP